MLIAITKREGVARSISRSLVSIKKMQVEIHIWLSVFVVAGVFFGLLDSEKRSIIPVVFCDISLHICL